MCFLGSGRAVGGSSLPDVTTVKGLAPDSRLTQAQLPILTCCLLAA